MHVLQLEKMFHCGRKIGEKISRNSYGWITFSSSQMKRSFVRCCLLVFSRFSCSLCVSLLSTISPIQNFFFLSLIYRSKMKEKQFYFSIKISWKYWKSEICWFKFCYLLNKCSHWNQNQVGKSAQIGKSTESIADEKCCANSVKMLDVCDTRK